MRKIQALTIATTILLLVSNARGEYTKDDGQNLISLIKQNSQAALCPKFGPLRAKSGAACNTTFNAAIALGVCSGFGDFAASNCENNALAALRKVGAAVDQNRLDAVRTVLLSILNRDKGTLVCNNVGVFLPAFVQKCMYLVGASMPEPKTTTPALLPSATVPLLTYKIGDIANVMKNIDLMKAELNNVQQKNSIKFLQLVNAIAQDTNNLNDQSAGQKNQTISSTIVSLQKFAKSFADAFVKKDTLINAQEINALGKSLEDQSAEVANIKKQLSTKISGEREQVRSQLVRALEVLEDLVDDAIASVSQK